ncbi:MAG: AsmA-like C-terminal domain-containing protein, partial [Alphaproteobacteria bacterium]
RLPSAKKSQKYKVDVDIKNIKTFDGNLGSRLWGSIHSNGKKYDLISMRLTMVRPSARTFLYYNKKKLRFYSEDISSAYSMLSGTNPTKGGRIGMVGDVDEKGIIKGNVSLTDINVLDVPESTRLLKLFSVVGIFDALQSKTLEFKSIRGKFSLKDGVYSTENISALGKTIAVSAKGNININDSTLDLKGMILPSYKLGSVIKDIPIIGQIISGADGQGPITQKYTAKGTFEDYEVKVDSTGLFTLGILRNVFDVFTSSDEVPVIFDDEQSSNENQED